MSLISEIIDVSERIRDFTGPNLRVALLREGAVLPQTKHTGDAGYDLSACIDDAVVIEPGEQEQIPTGVAMSFSPNYVGILVVRSSVGIKGLNLPNAPGIMDSGFRGEIIPHLYNSSHEAVAIRPGERFAQLVLVRLGKSGMHLVGSIEDLASTDRGGGFGSTGR